MNTQVEELIEKTKLTSVEKAGIYGRFGRLREKSKVNIGYSTLGDMVALAQHRKALFDNNLAIRIAVGCGDFNDSDAVCTMHYEYVPLDEEVSDGS